MVKEAYLREFGRSLEKDVKKMTSGDYNVFLSAILTAGREENGGVNTELATKEANDLIQAGVGTLGTDEELFNKIMCLRSFAQLKATFDAYKKQTDRDIETDIRKEFSGQLRRGLLTIGSITTNSYNDTEI